MLPFQTSWSPRSSFWARKLPRLRIAVERGRNVTDRQAMSPDKRDDLDKGIVAGAHWEAPVTQPTNSSVPYGTFPAAGVNLMLELPLRNRYSFEYPPPQKISLSRPLRLS